MMQHQMLRAMHEELMLEEIVEPRMQRDIERCQPEPERQLPRQRHLRLAHATREQQRGEQHHDHHGRRRLPGFEPVEQSHRGFFTRRYLVCEGDLTANGASSVSPSENCSFRCTVSPGAILCFASSSIT